MCVKGANIYLFRHDGIPTCLLSNKTGPQRHIPCAISLWRSFLRTLLSLCGWTRPLTFPSARRSRSCRALSSSQTRLMTHTDPRQSRRCDSAWSGRPRTTAEKGGIGEISPPVTGGLERLSRRVGDHGRRNGWNIVGAGMFKSNTERHPQPGATLSENCW